MQSYTDIDQALYNQLLTVVGIPAKIERDGQKVKPTSKEDWARVTLIPGEPIQESLSIHGSNSLSGVYQIDLFFPPAKKTPSEINTLVDSIVNSYTSALFLTENTTSVEVNMAWRDTAFSESDWHRQTVYVRWQSSQTRN
jgi:hypothetical protein